MYRLYNVLRKPPIRRLLKVWKRTEALKIVGIFLDKSRHVLGDSGISYKPINLVACSV